MAKDIPVRFGMLLPGSSSTEDFLNVYDHPGTGSVEQIPLLVVDGLLLIK